MKVTEKILQKRTDSWDQYFVKEPSTGKESHAGQEDNRLPKDESGRYLCV